MGQIIILKVVLSLLLVVLCFYGILKLIQKYGMFWTGSNNQPSDLKIKSIIYLDANTKILNLRKNKNSYIIAINKNNMLLIDKLMDTDEPIK